MKNILKLEELGMLGLAIFGLWKMEVNWWWYPLLVLGPDIGLLGYSGGNKMGAFIYNIFHHKGVAVAFFIIGSLLPDPILQLVGIVIFGHSSMDRVFGYGLKLVEGFRNTHLGMIGKK